MKKISLLVLLIMSGIIQGSSSGDSSTGYWEGVRLSKLAYPNKRLNYHMQYLNPRLKSIVEYESPAAIAEWIDTCATTPQHIVEPEIVDQVFSTTVNARPLNARSFVMHDVGAADLSTVRPKRNKNKHNALTPPNSQHGSSGVIPMSLDAPVVPEQVVSNPLVLPSSVEVVNPPMGHVDSVSQLSNQSLSQSKKSSGIGTAIIAFFTGCCS